MKCPCCGKTEMKERAPDMELRLTRVANKNHGDGVGGTVHLREVRIFNKEKGEAEDGIEVSCPDGWVVWYNGKSAWGRFYSTRKKEIPSDLEALVRAAYAWRY